MTKIKEKDFKKTQKTRYKIGKSFKETGKYFLLGFTNMLRFEVFAPTGARILKETNPQYHLSLNKKTGMCLGIVAGFSVTMGSIIALYDSPLFFKSLLLTNYASGIYESCGNVPNNQKYQRNNLEKNLYN